MMFDYFGGNIRNEESGFIGGDPNLLGFRCEALPSHEALQQQLLNLNKQLKQVKEQDSIICGVIWLIEASREVMFI